MSSLPDTFSISRSFAPKDFGKVTVAQLHHFCDASEVGYGWVSYLRLLSNQDVSVAFVMGKARVAPLKQITIPRLELAAAVLAVRMDKMLKAELDMKLESVFWSDSMTVLQYIANRTKRFKTYVANRISIIHELSKVEQWRHVSSKLNPADVASRGLRADGFLSSGEWIKGPQFLFKRPSHWPGKVNMQDMEEALGDDPEVKSEIPVYAVVMEQKECPINKLLNYFSRWTDLRRAVAWILKLKEMLLLQMEQRKNTHPDSQGQGHKPQQKVKTDTLRLSVSDLNAAEKAVYCFVQKQAYPEEVAALQRGTLKRTSHLFKLDPQIVDGVLRVGGRLHRSALPEDTKHPVILPKSSHVSTLILRHIHQKVGHGGRNHMLSTLRRRYWIPHANTAARAVIRNCMVCKRQRQRPGEQKMADLPADRITADLPPFTDVGMDYFGPMEVKQGQSIVKRYGVIFTCLTSRGVHLEVAHTLDTDSCINAIRRFLCRRGQVRNIRSDNGTNFVSANRQLKLAVKELNQDKIHRSLMQDGIQWSFNPPHGDHGGVWERLVQQVKKVLCTVVKQQILNDEALNTVLCEVEAILNDRPITPSTDDPNDLEALTPNHLLQLKANPLLPPGLFKREDLYTRRRWRQIQYIASLFWKRWVKEYLPLMQTRQKWGRTRRSFAVGDLVLVMDDSAPRNSWLLGRINETIVDSKGHVRRVRLRTQTSELEQLITKLCLLLEEV